MPQDGLFAVGIQQGSGANDYAKLADGYGNAETTHLDYFPLTDCDLGITKVQDNLPPELGGKALTFGTFTTGVWGGGTASIIARLEQRLGWLLLAATGEVSTVTGTAADQLSILGGTGTTADVDSHIFNFSNDDEFMAPWLTIYRKLPHVTDAEEVGEILQDARLGTFTLNATAGAPVGIDMGFVGRRYQSNEFDVDPGWSATFDDLSTFAVPSCTGHFKVGGTSMKVTAFSLNINNNVLPPAQSLYIGSIDPLDFPLLTRTVTVNATVLVENYDLYMSTFVGSAHDVSVDGDAASACTVYEADFEAMVSSQTLISGTSERNELWLLSNRDYDNTAWTVQPIRLTPGRPVVLQVTGNIQAVSGQTAFYMVLQNSYDTGYALL